MQSCLGIQVENDVIKYAKVQQEKDLIKVEAFNIVFFENLEKTIQRIIEETNSYKTPIVVNLSDEKYDYFQVSGLMNRNDRKAAVQIDFDLFCEEKNINKNTIETRFLFTSDPNNADMVRVIAVSANQGDLEQKKINLVNYKLQEISPLPTSIANLIEKNEKENSIIINIENKTNITTILKGEIVKIDNINEGMGEILDKINFVENSKQKSYEVCKNTTIYSQQGIENVSEGNEHLDAIMPTLNSIIAKTKNIIEANGIGIGKIYITGLATAINNIDLYFQEFFPELKCEILKPFFSTTSSIKTSIKDYIEVNSAIALALDGIGYGFEELNFISKKSSSKGFVKRGDNVPKKTSVPKSSKVFNKEKMSLTGTLQPLEWLFIRISVVMLITILGYILVTFSLNEKIKEEVEMVTDAIASAEAEVKKADNDIKVIQEKSDEYGKAIEELKKLEENGLSATIVPKSAIPNLLYRLIEATPAYVRIISIENTTGTHIVINAESEYYEQLGFLNAVITTNQYLLNVKSTSGVKVNGMVNVTIEGDLPQK